MTRLGDMRNFHKMMRAKGHIDIFLQRGLASIYLYIALKINDLQKSNVPISEARACDRQMESLTVLQSPVSLIITDSRGLCSIPVGPMTTNSERSTLSVDARPSLLSAFTKLRITASVSRGRPEKSYLSFVAAARLRIGADGSVKFKSVTASVVPRTHRERKEKRKLRGKVES